MEMTRDKCEKLITEKIKEIYEIYKQYNPEGKYLTACITDGHIFVNNKCWKTEDEVGDDYDTPIDVFSSLNEEEDNEDEQNNTEE